VLFRSLRARRRAEAAIRAELRAHPWRVVVMHSQFVVRDLTPARPAADDCDPWTEDALAANVGELPGELYVGTADTTRVDVELAVHDGRPSVDLDACVWATEASLDVPSGRISVDELLSDPGRRTVDVPPGSYRVLVRSLEEGGGDVAADRMALDLWRAPPAPVAVLKPS
jgi:hypothetical protein